MQPDARERLERAALELRRGGFSETTIPRVTARAGLRTRTFFRHSPTSARFCSRDEVPAQVAELMADAAASLSPMALIVRRLPILAAAGFESRGEHLRDRRAVIEADEGCASASHASSPPCRRPSPRGSETEAPTS